jgi:hypothetical protein
VIDLYGRVRVGAKVIVLPAGPRAAQSRIEPVTTAYR